MRLVLDTSAVSAVMHRLPDALDRFRHYKPGQIILSSPVAAEIYFGLERLAKNTRKRRNLEAEYQRLRRLVRWADWTEGAAEEFGRQKARLARLGQLIADMDLAIGSLALSLGARVATHNVRHLSRLQGLVVEDWSQPSPARP